MAIENAKTLNVRIKNKYDSYENWASSGLILEAGEIAIAYSSIDVQVDNGTVKHPFLLMKVGDGEKTFANLPWLSAKAADVLEAVKSESGLTTFIKNVVAAGDGDLAALTTRVTTAEGEIDAIQLELDKEETGLKARMTAAEADIDALEALVGDKEVATQISDAIAALNLATTYDAFGAAATAKSEAVAHADGLNTAMNTRVEALEAIDHDHTNKAELDKITDGDVAKWNAAEQNAKDYADGLDEVMDGRVAALEAKFGDGEGNVEAQITAAVAAEKTERENADKALQEQITANDGEIAALQGLVGDKKVSEQITDVTNPLDARVTAIEGDYLKAADKKALQDQIDANESAIELLTNGVSAEEVDGVNDLIQYVKDHGAEVTGMKEDIQDNTDAIAAEKERAEGVEGGLETRLQAVEAAVGDEGAVAGDIAAALTEAKGYTDTEVKKLADGAVATNAADIDALETKVGDETVAAQIEAAIEALKIGDYAKAADLTAAINQHNTDKAALEAEIAKKANAADLAAIAKTGSTDDLVQGDLVLLFDCGTSAV